ncbi:hypothetical protein SteCoe_24839 [Stentor coeruleus]|uniref:BTB domain-containing protein n=1 Tax=Stentor coeruleus TaxID=5963 RepID=A0A1R2BGN8_9CILI|nr:hypothetical protein SteCoe_24839 [Stentor coeruleus]
MSEILYLSVGGVKYETTRQTLCCDQNSMLAAMFSGRHTLACNSKGYYFIDRDGKLFRYILNFLRNQELTISQDNTNLISELLKEAEFYQLKSMISALEELKHKSELTYISYKELLILINSSRPIQAPFLNLSCLVLKFLDFSNANLQGCDFSQTSIFEVNFTHANLSSCIFDNSVVQNSIFTDCVLRQASLVSANFSGNDMKRAVCIETNFMKAKLGGADMRNSDLQSANLQDANLLVANMEGCNLLLANIKGTNLEGANLKGAKGFSYQNY